MLATPVLAISLLLTNTLLAAALELVASLVVDLSQQQLRAYDAAGRLIYRAPVSTGLPATPTPTGRFQVAGRYPETSLSGADYRIPGVRDVICLGGGGLKPDAICLHPAPWQEQARQCFGVRRSHGCVRLSSATARWLFERTAVGTPVTIQE
jgi:lipoprotein-anchoring transpeptidase ErfK/SrfK